MVLEHQHGPSYDKATTLQIQGRIDGVGGKDEMKFCPDTMPKLS